MHRIIPNEMVLAVWRLRMFGFTGDPVQHRVLAELGCAACFAIFFIPVCLAEHWRRNLSLLRRWIRAWICWHQYAVAEAGRSCSDLYRARTGAPMAERLKQMIRWDRFIPALVVWRSCIKKFGTYESAGMEGVPVPTNDL